MKTLKLKNYFGSFAFYSDALKIAVPVMAQALIQTLVSLIDNFMVAGLGDIKMSGVNITGQLLFMALASEKYVAKAKYFSQ